MRPTVLNSADLLLPADLLPAAQAPSKKTIAAIATTGCFAIIGVVATFKFFVNLVADGLAYSTNSRREEEWAPTILAVLFTAYCTHFLLSKLLAEPSVQKPKTTASTTNTNIELLKKSPTQPITANDLQKISKILSDGKQKSSSAADTEFADNLRRAGAKLFAQPATRSSTRLPSPVDSDNALLNAALNDVFAPSRPLGAVQGLTS